MKIRMAGLDYERMSLEEREVFSFTKEKAAAVLNEIYRQDGVLGCVLIFTCNRTELYVHEENWDKDLFERLCHALTACQKLECKTELKKGGERADVSKTYWDYRDKSIEREGEGAVTHLFEVACGMKSKIFGEDQIIAQVKDAWLLARDAKTTDVVLERLFQMAVAAAKKVKTEVHLTGVKTSVIETMIQKAEEIFPTLDSMPCLVIGNGEIGRLAASRLLEAKAKVTMTVRHYKTKEVIIPVGCQIIDYHDRYEYAEQAKIIVSATSSPHHTLLWEKRLDKDGNQLLFQDSKKRLLFDLAMPRDISSKFGELKNIILYNIDSLGGTATDAVNNEAVAEALEILEEQEREFAAWYYFRGYIPAIQEIEASCAKDVYKRVEKKVKKIVPEDAARDSLEHLIETAAGKVVGKLMYGMRDYLDKDSWQNYIEAIGKIVTGNQI